LSTWNRLPEASMSRHQFWWQGGPQMDAEITTTFGTLHARLSASPITSFDPAQFKTRRELAEVALATVLVLSQFSRHINRGTAPSANQRRLAHWSARAFDNDPTARQLSRWIIAEGLDKHLFHYEKMFLNLVFVQSEDLADQDHAVAYVDQMNKDAIAAGLRSKFSSGGVGWCQERRDVVAKFGRLPFRNSALGRESTRDEVRFLANWGRGMA